MQLQLLNFSFVASRCNFLAVCHWARKEVCT